MEELKRTFVAVIHGEAVMAFRADDEDEAHDLVHGEESEQGGIKTVLMEYDRANGSVIWDGHSEIAVRLATDSEHMRWQQSSDATDPDDRDDPDDRNVFLIPISDPSDDEDEDEPDEPKVSKDRTG
jgi:hypothetical protein